MGPILVRDTLRAAPRNLTAIHGVADAVVIILFYMTHTP